MNISVAPAKAPGRPPALWPIARPMHRQKPRHWRCQGPPPRSFAQVDRFGWGKTWMLRETWLFFFGGGGNGGIFQRVSKFRCLFFWGGSFFEDFHLAAFSHLQFGLHIFCLHLVQDLQGMCPLSASLSERVVEIHYGDIVVQLNLNKTWYLQ